MPTMFFASLKDRLYNAYNVGNSEFRIPIGNSLPSFHPSNPSLRSRAGETRLRRAFHRLAKDFSVERTFHSSNLPRIERIERVKTKK